MARPQVPDGGDGLQVWRAAANAINKQSREPARGCPPVWGLLVEQTTRRRKNDSVTKCYTGIRTWTESVKLRKMDMRPGRWNVRSLYRAGSLMTVEREESKYRLDSVGVQEVRWVRGRTEPTGD
jgi:hypothetical protein